ncbi:MAG: hypothetical protein B6D43_04220 [Ignavibacteriales bacterium UTCHB1]|jgi:hypothetical protein|nr:MAG: hypothetical protein B6D43_04220 [Ignavibacteriales bacterium UTCHB1]
MFIESGSDGHNADKVEVEVDNPALAFKSLTEAGFVQDGYTLTGKTVHLFDFSKGGDVEFKQKLVNFINKFKQYGGQIKSKERNAIRSEYLTAERRGKILERIDGTRLQQQQSGSSLHNAIREAKARNEAYQKFKETLDSPERKRLTELWTKQIDGAILSLEERREISRLEKELAKPLELFFTTDKGRYERAKVEIEAIAKDLVGIVKNAFVSPSGIKRSKRASIKSVRWYESQVNKLGDGARVNIIVDNNKDADFLYSEIKRRFSTTLDRSEFFPEGTELGYPKRLIEIRTPSGKIAEIQVMTPEGYLAKDGVVGFPKDKIFIAKTELVVICFQNVI